MAEEEMYKEKRNRKDYWMTVGIEVKLTYYKLPKDLLYRHAVIMDMEDDYTVTQRTLCDFRFNWLGCVRKFLKCFFPATGSRSGTKFLED